MANRSSDQMEVEKEDVERVQQMLCTHFQCPFCGSSFTGSHKWTKIWADGRYYWLCSKCLCRWYATMTQTDKDKDKDNNQDKDNDKDKNNEDNNEMQDVEMAN